MTQLCKEMPPQESLRAMLHYDPDTGIFTWVHQRGRQPAGSQAGTVNHSGYITISHLGKKYVASRVAWTYMTGDRNPPMIDHKDTVRSNNEWSNLREATCALNLQNSILPHRNNKSGYKGVHWCKHAKAWLAKIHIRGKTTTLGRFDTPEEAHAAYLKAKRELHPFWDEAAQL